MEAADDFGAEKLYIPKTPLERDLICISLARHSIGQWNCHHLPFPLAAFRLLSIAGSRFIVGFLDRLVCGASF